MKTINLCKILSLFVLALSLPVDSSALTSVSSVVLNQLYQTGGPDEGTPVTPTIGAVLTDGGFTIIDQDLLSTTVLGDGVDEKTSWIFNFTSDPNYISYLNLNTPLISAQLYLGLTPKNILVSTDAFALDGFSCFGGADGCLKPDPFGSLPLNVSQIIQINLLTYYTSGDINKLFNDNFGTISAAYADDASIYYAALVLVKSPVPEPATMLLFGTGIAGLAAVGRRRS